MAHFSSILAAGVGDSQLRPPTAVGILSVLRVSAAHAAGGAREGKPWQERSDRIVPTDKPFSSVQPCQDAGEIRDCGGAAGREYFFFFSLDQLWPKFVSVLEPCP